MARQTIPAPAGISAFYEGSEPRPVIAFDAMDSRPLVLFNGESRAGLVPADQIPGYRWTGATVGIPVMAVPGGGWLCRYEDGFTTPVVAWVLTSDGHLDARVCDGDGVASSPGSAGTVFHPDYPWQDEVSSS